MDVFLNNKQGEEFCGDRYLVIKRTDSCLYVVIDGIGHGQKASIVADIAYDSIMRSANADLIDIIQDCQTALLDTRGVVISFILFAFNEKKIDYYAVGNVESALISSDSIIALKTRRGIFGAIKHPIKIQSMALPSPVKVLMHTDGIGNVSGHLRQQFSKMNSRHIVQILAQQWSGDDDICILCEQVHDE